MIPYDLPHWNLEPGKLFVFGEQGIGDEIMFASCLHDIKDCEVTLETEPRLVSVLQRSFPDIRVIGRIGTFAEPVPQYRECDYQVPIGDLPVHFRHSVSDFPGTRYLIPDSERVEFWKDRLKQLGDPPYIGLSWRGRTAKASPEEVRDFFGHQGTYINLQYDWFHSEIKDWMHNLEPETRDYDDMFALVKALDRVNTTPTSILHVAGSMGKECNVMFLKENNANDFRLNWRFRKPPHNEMLWHRSVKIWR